MARTPEQTEALLDKLEELLKNYDQAEDTFKRGEWSKKFEDKLGKYSDKLKLLNGDDFDIMSASYDEYNKDYSDLSDDEYCDKLEENIKSVISRIWPEASEEQVEEAVDEIKDAAEDSEGKTETHIEAEDKDDDGKISEDEIETHTLEEDATSDARQKRVAKMSKSWAGSPHTSGGREGHTSDEEQKKPVDSEGKELKTAEDGSIKVDQRSDEQKAKDKEEFKQKIKAYDPMARFR